MSKMKCVGWLWKLNCSHWLAKFECWMWIGCSSGSVKGSKATCPSKNNFSFYKKISVQIFSIWNCSCMLQCQCVSFGWWPEEDLGAILCYLLGPLLTQRRGYCYPWPKDLRGKECFQSAILRPLWIFTWVFIKPTLNQRACKWYLNNIVQIWEMCFFAILPLLDKIATSYLCIQYFNIRQYLWAAG